MSLLEFEHDRRTPDASTKTAANGLSLASRVERLDAVWADCARAGFYFGQHWSSTEALMLAHALGAPVADARDARLVKPVSPQPMGRATPNTLSSRYGMGAFPFHTDTAYWQTPADFLLLRCVAPGRAARPTLLVDTAEWVFDVPETDALQRGMWRVRAARPFLAALMEQRPDGRRAIRFAADCMDPASLTAKHAKAVVNTRLASSSTQLIEWRAGALLVIDNRRCLHARGAADIDDTDRVLERTLVRTGP